MNPGEEQNERDHFMRGENTSSGPFGDRNYRHAQNGWFSWNLKVQPGHPQELQVTYWGSDNGVFDVYVDDTKIATERLTGKHPEPFYDETYPLPETLTRDKERVTVRFVAHPQNFAGGVFGVRVLKR